MPSEPNQTPATPAAGPAGDDPLSSGSGRLTPIASFRQRLWQMLSNLFIVAGVGLLAAGGWMAYQQQAPVAGLAPPPLPPEALSLEGNPLPAEALSLEGNPLPVVEFASPTPEPSPSATPSPTASPTLQPGETPSPTRAATPSATPTPTPSPVPPAQSAPERIVAPAIGLDAPVVAVGWHQVEQGGQTVSVWEVAEYAAGWHRNSALPGRPGNTVLSGHHNIKGEVFRYLVDLEPGNLISLVADGRTYTYAVEQKFILKDKGEPPEVRQQNARWIGPFRDERLTLVTCWPYNNNTHRLIVVAKPVPGLEVELPPPPSTPEENPSFIEDIFR